MAEFDQSASALFAASPMNQSQLAPGVSWKSDVLIQLTRRSSVCPNLPVAQGDKTISSISGVETSVEKNQRVCIKCLAAHWCQ